MLRRKNNSRGITRASNGVNACQALEEVRRQARAACEIRGKKREKMSKKSAYQTSSFCFYRRQIQSTEARRHRWSRILFCSSGARENRDRSYVVGRAG